MIGASPLVLCSMQIEQGIEEEIRHASSLQKALRQNRACLKHASPLANRLAKCIAEKQKNENPHVRVPVSSISKI
jgi:hypothetical protein